MKWLLLFPLVAGCAATTQYAKWPVRGPMLKVTNTTEHTRTISARDGLGRELITARLKPGKSLCFRWPFIDYDGALFATGNGTATVSTGRFKPWDADGWEWQVGSDAVANASVCR
jgi:hypothetical protein